MANLNELPKPLQVVGILGIAALVLAGLYLGFYLPRSRQNQQEWERLHARLTEVNDLRKYENNLPELNRQIENLKEQLDIQSRIVPSEEEADQFMHLMQNTAQASGIEIRRWTAKPVVAKEYYTEVPFDLELDGPYYSVLNFFERVAKLERIINVSNLQLTSLKGDAKGTRSFEYAPQETVAGSCTATTFFSHDAQLAAPAAPRGK
jgi:type IV pilus assembly protein PilO